MKISKPNSHYDFFFITCRNGLKCEKNLEKKPMSNWGSDIILSSENSTALEEGVVTFIMLVHIGSLSLYICKIKDRSGWNSEVFSLIHLLVLLSQHDSILEYREDAKNIQGAKPRKILLGKPPPLLFILLLYTVTAFVGLIYLSHKHSLFSQMLLKKYYFPSWFIIGYWI